MDCRRSIYTSVCKIHLLVQTESVGSPVETEGDLFLEPTSWADREWEERGEGTAGVLPTVPPLNTTYTRHRRGNREKNERERNNVPFLPISIPQQITWCSESFQTKCFTQWLKHKLKSHSWAVDSVLGIKFKVRNFSHKNCTAYLMFGVLLAGQWPKNLSVSTLSLPHHPCPGSHGQSSRLEVAPCH